jgi:hypothetical protein
MAPAYADLRERQKLPSPAKPAVEAHENPRGVAGMALAPGRRMLSLSPSARLLFVKDHQRARLLHLDREVVVADDGLVSALAFDDQIWLLRESGRLVVGRIDSDGVEFGEPIPLPEIGSLSALRRAPTGAPSAILVGERTVEVRQDCERLVAHELSGRPELIAPLGPRRWLAWSRDGVFSCRPDGKTRLCDSPGPGRDLAAFFGGNAAALLSEETLWVIDTRSGALQQRIHAGDVRAMRVAHRRGWAILHRGDNSLCVIDLRYGRLLAVLPREREVLELEVDADAQVLALQEEDLTTSCHDLAELMAAPPPEPAVVMVDAPAPPRPILPPPPPPAIDVAALAAAELKALGPRPAFSTWSEERVEADLGRALDLVAAWCKRALAVAWDSGRIAFAAGGLPFEDEAAALFDGGRGRAEAQRLEAERRVRELEREIAPESPLGRLAGEFGLSPLAQKILLVVAAPQLRGELARAYALVANDPARPMCDELLLAQLLDTPRRALARELDADAPLVRHGLIQIGAGRRPFASLEAPAVVARRMCGEVLLHEGRAADRSLAQLLLPPELVHKAVAALRKGHPARVVVRARRGTGGTSLLAALASQAGRTLGVIDAGLLSVAELRAELQQTALRGLLPCIVEAAADDPTRRAELRQLLASHPGPIVFRLSPGALPPLAPGYLVLDVPTPDAEQRTIAWRDALSRAGLPVDDAEQLAARYRVGAGTIERVARELDRQDDLAAAVERTLRQHRETAIGDVATRVTRLASWSSVVLPPEVLDSVREFIGRVSHRRKVFEEWGFDRLLTSSRGLTALFSGGPGTGKSMVAGIIARELGYDLYRVDLSRVLSKWVGETEKNLARVFDAAEDGDVVLLFDEADSLFAKRTTDVRGANDRYANLEVNYLLERMDQFDGIAILTTNSVSAIDPAFKRRLSFRLTFPFPDEETRESLWRVHLPPAMPVEGELDLRQLAERFQLSGGYIRNAAVRAAFLAAQDGGAVTQAHLERAVLLEYREVGKVIESGVLE